MSVVSRLPHIPPAEITRLLSRTGRSAVRVEVQRPGGAWTDLTAIAGGDWVVGASADLGTPDQPVRRHVVRFLARAEGRAVAPGISSDAINRAGATFAPLLYPGAHVRVYAGNAASGTPTMRLWFQGRAESVEWPDNDVVLHVASPEAELDRAWITTEGEERGAPDPGVPLQQEIQSLISTFGPGGVSLRVLPDDDIPDYMDIGVGPYETSRVPLYSFVREWAQREGAELRYIMSEADGAERLTLFLPPRDDTTPRLTLSKGQVLAVDALSTSREFVRNDFELEGRRADGEVFLVSHSDPTSQAQFGRSYMFIREGEESPIRTPAAGLRVLHYAAHDLAQPPTDLRVRIPWCPWITLHDVIAVAPDDVRFDYQTTWSVVGGQHEVGAENQDGWYTELLLRGGSPVGMYYGWFREWRGRVVSGAPAEQPVTLLDFDVLNRTEETAEARWITGARVRYVWIWLRRVRQPVPMGHNPAPGPGDPPDVILSAGEESYVLPVPPPGYLLYAYFVPMDEALGRGPMERVVLNPTNEPPDEITNLSIQVDDSDGSVWVRVEAVDRTESYRYAYTVGTDPTPPSDAEVQAGPVRTINGGDAFELPAGTVEYNERIRLRAAPYTGTDGRGTDGPADHGEIRGAEDVRERPPVSLEPGAAVESEGTGSYTVTVRDPGGYATGLYVRTKAGEAPWTAWTQVAAPPVDGQSYTTSVALIEGHMSAIEYRLRYESAGASGFVSSVSPNMDRGAIPDVRIVPSLNEDTGTASASVLGDSDTFGVRVAARTDRYPTEAEVRARPLVSGRMLTPAEIGTLAAIQPGQTVYFGALGYGPNGEESSAMAKAEALFQPLAPTLSVTTQAEDHTSGIGLFGVTVKDPGGQADELFVRIKRGAAPWGAWMLVSGAPASGVEYLETVLLEESHPSYVEFRLDYTLSGELFSIHQPSPGFDRGKIPDPALVPNVDPATGVVSASIQGDYDTGSSRVLAWEQSAYPGDAAALTAVRSAPVRAGRTVMATPLLTLQAGQTAVVACLGYANADGTGLESSALIKAEIGYQTGSIPPKVHAQLTRVGGVATLSLTITDPEKRVTAVEFNKREGGGMATGWVSSWDTSTGVPGTDADMVRTEAVAVPAGTDSEISWRVRFTDETGFSRTLGDTVPVSNLGGVAKSIRISHQAFRIQPDSSPWASGKLSLATGPSGAVFAEAPLVLPPGVTITHLRIRGQRQSPQDEIVRMELYRIDAADNTPTLATAAITAQGTHTAAAALGEVVQPAYTYGLFLSLVGNPSAPVGPTFFWTEIAYFAPDYSKTY